MPPLDEQAIFEAARRLDFEAREAFLQKVCGQRAATVARVRALLKAYEEGESFLESPAAPLIDTSAEPNTEQPGEHIGPYKLLELIGEGGMGTVWMAQQTEPLKRTVALKVIRAGMDSKAVIARFDAERQALALMDHPNIAKVLDAGAAMSGRLYFVMELIKGLPITKYCDEHHLTPRQRLELFVPVCQAIQHAHQKGVIHRDLKPSNVLVTPYDGKPVPKVIDFGVAKAAGQSLTDKTLVTGFGNIVGTLEYMSPEQAEINQLDIDTRSDIYSLGALLYELLVGSPPFSRKDLEHAGMLEMLRVIREQEPTKPSVKLSTAEGLPTLADNRGTEPAKLTKLVRGELDWIVMKALEKERGRRYETANDFAADIGCFLHGDPVLAAPPSAGYRLRKFLGRHRGPVTAAATIAVILLAGIFGTSLGWREALSQRDYAESERLKAENSACEADSERKKAQDSAREASAQRVRAERQLAFSEFRQYLLQFRQAEAAIERRHMHTARELLNECDPKLRGWEHGYLLRQTLPRLDLGSHTARVSSVAISPDGMRIASASGQHGISGEVKVWNAATGHELLTLRGHLNLINGVAFSPDGKRIVSGSYDRTVKVWDAATGQEMLILKGHDLVTSVAFSADGKQIASGSEDKTVKIWDASIGQEVRTLKGHTHQVASIAFSTDSKRIVSGSGESGNNFGEVIIWDAATGQETTTLKSRGAKVAFSDDGKQVLSWESGNNVVKVWDAATGQEVSTLRLTPTVAKVSAINGQEFLKMPQKGHTHRVACVAFSQDGKRIVSGGGYLGHSGEVKVWDVATGQELLTQKGHDLVTSVAFSADGKRIVSVDGTVKVWDIATEEPVLTLKGHDGGVGCLAFSPDSQQVASGSGDKTVKVWNAVTGREMLTLKWHTSAVKCVAYSPDGKRIISGSFDQTIKVWDASTGQDVLTLKGHTSGVSSVAFSNDGKRILSGSGDGIRGEIKIWDAATGGEILTWKGHTRGVKSVAFSPDGQRVVSGGWGQTVKVWDATTGKEVFTLKGHANSICNVAFSPTGKRIISGANGGETPAKPHKSLPVEIKVWDAATGQEIRTFFLNEYKGEVLAHSADGKRTLSGGARWGVVNDGIRPPIGGEVKIWDATTGLETLTLTGHTRGVSSVAFSPDGKRIASGSDDRTIHIWDATTGPDTFTLEGHTGFITSVAFSPNDRTIVSGSLDKTIKVWDAATGLELHTLRGHTGPVFSVAISTDNNRIVSASGDRTVKVWNAVNGQETLTLKGHTDLVTSVAWSADGKRIVSGSLDKTIKVWDAATGQEELTLKGHSNGVTYLAFSVDGKQIIAGDADWTIRVWDVATAKEVFKFSVQEQMSRGGDPSLSADGKRILSGYGGFKEEPRGNWGAVKAWDVATGRALLTLEGHSNEVTSCAFSADGKRIVCGCHLTLPTGKRQGEVKVWDVATGKAITLKGHTDWISSVAFSFDGRRIVSGSWDWTIKVWKLPPPP